MAECSDPRPRAACLSQSLRETIADQGFAFVGADSMRAQLDPGDTLTDWAAFADSWNRLETDTYMADGGRYRRRRHAVFAIEAQGGIQRRPHQPHWQSRDYNPLNGGIARWFAPVEEAVADSRTLRGILDHCRRLFSGLAPAVPRWHVEVHQFRIEARSDAPGQPTPEGLHRDGVNYVLVLLITRRNIASGTTSIHDLQGKLLGSFTLTTSFDTAVVDDARVFHGVTPVQPIDAAQPAYRDVLVVTFRKDEAAATAAT
jgi:hypothetical protein